jgi:hypothetical protein
MADKNVVLVEVTRECVFSLGSEMRNRVLGGTLETDDMVALVYATMARLMRRMGELAGPEMAVETFFPVVLTLLFEVVQLPDHSATMMGALN